MSMSPNISLLATIGSVANGTWYVSDHTSGSAWSWIVVALIVMLAALAWPDSE